MAPRLSKHTLFLRAGDMLFLQQAYGEGSGSVAVRTLVANHVDKLKQNPSALIDIEEDEETTQYRQKHKKLLLQIAALQKQLEELG